MSSEKPTGRIGPLQVSLRDAHAVAEWRRIEWPSNKAKIETYIVQRFLSAGHEAGFTFISVKQNEESNIDFTLELPGGSVLLELTELIYRPNLSAEGDPYGSGHARVEVEQYAAQILAAIGKKQIKYVRPPNTPIHLLLYTTHWSFVPAESVIRLVQHSLRSSGSIFENIFYLDIFDDQTAIIRCFFPVPEAILAGFEPSDVAGQSYLLLDPAKGRALSG